MTDIGSQVLIAIQVLMQPVNFGAVVLGTVAGALLGQMFRTIGASSMGSLMLILPVALLVDPTMGLMLLGAALTAALVATAHGHGDVPVMTHHHHVALTTLLAGLALMLASASAAAMVQSSTPADRIALLSCGIAAAVILAAATHPGGWLAALLLTGAGLAIGFSPWNPLAPDRPSPMPVLLGLLAIGPALVALGAPRRVVRTEPVLGGIELAATVLPAFLIGIPATRGISVFALNLSESGLYLGPRLMTQRPKLVLGFVAALAAAAVLSWAGRMLVRSLAASPRWPRIGQVSQTRGAAALVLALSVALVLYCRVEPGMEGLVVLAIVASGIAAWFGIELAPLVTGMVIAQAMQPSIKAATLAGGGNTLKSLMSASPTLIALAIMALALALSWPWAARRFGLAWQ